MMRQLLQCRKFFEGLLEVDQEIASRAQGEGCPHCGGRLHVANFPRKPRGIPAGLIPRWNLRQSFCCAVDGCRRRRTPPSVRFFGRRVYAAVLFLWAALTDSVDGCRADSGASRRTVSRWRRWWRVEYPQSELGRELRGRWMEASTPLAVSRHLSGAPPNRMLSLLSLFAARSEVAPCFLREE